MDIFSVIGNILPVKVKSRIKKIFKKAYAKRKEKLIDKRRKHYHQYALEALTKFDECMRKNGFKYTLAYGTLLGAIREHGFIKHDLDMDTWMFIEDDNENIVPELKKYGFNLLYHYSVDNDKYGKEYTFDYKGCHVDIFFIYPPVDKLPYCTDYVWSEGMRKHERLPRRLELPISKEIRLEMFEDLMLPIPANAEQLCEFRYGKDYMTPNPQWDCIEEAKDVVDWPEMISKTTHTEYSI